MTQRTYTNAELVTALREIDETIQRLSFPSHAGSQRQLDVRFGIGLAVRIVLDQFAKLGVRP